MNDEIKEILDYLRDKDNYIEEFWYQYKRVSLGECSQLLDYITNLQKENERLQTTANNCKEVIEYIYKLQQNDDIEIWREDGYWAYLLNILNGSDENE